MLNKSSDLSKFNVPIYFSLILGFILNFSLWFGDKFAVKNADTVCSRFIQTCERFIFFSGLPESWDMRIFQFFLFLCLTASILSFFQLKHRWAKLFLIFPLIIEGLWGFILFEQSSIPFIYYHFFPCLIFIFSKKPENDLKWLVVLFYILAGWVKLDESWLAGGYFQALELGLPLFPKILILPVSLFVTFMELTSFALLLNNKKVRHFYFYFFCIFHLYSFIIVGYQYPLLCLPLLFFTFANKDQVTIPSSFAILCGSFLIIFNLLPHFIDDEYKLTGQGDSLALNMFDGNRQSFSKMMIHKRDGKQETIELNTKHAYERVKPYHYWFRARQQCGTDVERISWTLDISLNGLPFQRVVDVENVCSLNFNPFGKNQWITPDASPLGSPAPNTYRTGGWKLSNKHIHATDSVQDLYFQWINVNKVYLRWGGIIFSLMCLIFVLGLNSLLLKRNKSYNE